MVWRGYLRFSVTVDGVVLVGSEVVGVGMVDLRVMVLELYSSFGGLFYLELDGVEEWISGGVVSMLDVTSGFQGVPGLATCLG